MRQPEALFDEVVFDKEFAKGPELRKIIFLIDEHSKIAPAIYARLKMLFIEDGLSTPPLFLS
jgi:hypothetical protein